MILAILFAATLPTFSCRGLDATNFCCVAVNIPQGEEPEWQLYYSPKEPDRAKGRSACFQADKEWRYIEMRTTEWRARAMVSTDGKTVLFKQAPKEQP